MVMVCCSGAVLGLGLSVKVITFISRVLFLIRRLENMFLLDGAVSEMCDPTTSREAGLVGVTEK